MDFFIGLIAGFALCGCIVIVVTLFKQATSSGSTEPEPDGVDDVLDELFKTVQNQPKTVHTEEEKQDLDWKFRE